MPPRSEAKRRKRPSGVQAGAGVERVVVGDPLDAAVAATPRCRAGRPRAARTRPRPSRATRGRKTCAPPCAKSTSGLAAAERAAHERHRPAAGPAHVDERARPRADVGIRRALAARDAAAAAAVSRSTRLEVVVDAVLAVDLADRDDRLARRARARARRSRPRPRRGRGPRPSGATRRSPGALVEAALEVRDEGAVGREARVLERPAAPGERRRRASPGRARTAARRPSAYARSAAAYSAQSVREVLAAEPAPPRPGRRVRPDRRALLARRTRRSLAGP